MACRYSIPLSRVSMIFLLIRTSPLRQASRRFSRRWENLLMLVRPKKPELPLRLCTGRNIRLMISALPGSSSRAMKSASIPWSESLDSSIKPRSASGSTSYCMSVSLFAGQHFEDLVDAVQFPGRCIHGVNEVLHVLERLEKDVVC